MDKLILLLEGKNAFDEGDYVTVIKKQYQLFPSIQFLKTFFYILLFPFINFLNKIKIILLKITIDASNLQEGGGIVHLKNLLQISDPRIHGFNKIIVYGGRKPLEQLSKKDWLDLREIKNLDRSIPDRLMWQKNFLNKNVKQENSLLFIPGGLFLGKSVKFVTMFQNMQIFETLEKKS